MSKRIALNVFPFVGLALLSATFYLFAQSNGYSITTRTDNVAQVLAGLSFFENKIIAGEGGFWDWSYGLGGDVFSELSYYFSTSPSFYFDFALKFVLGLAGGDLPQQIRANLIISIVHQILIMWAMFVLLRSEGSCRSLAFIGATVYGMSLWVVQHSIAFSFMVPAAFWLPVVVWAYRRYQRSGKWVGLSVVIGLVVSNSFYFGFQTCLFLITLFLFFSYEKGAGARAYVAKLAKLFGITAVGLMLAAASFAVSVGTLFGADRSPVAITVSFLPTWETIKCLPQFIFCGNLNNALLGIPAFCVLFLSLSFPRESDDAKRTLLALFWLIAFLVPFVSNLMNGLSTGLNRWHYIVLFMFAWNIPHWLKRYLKSTPRMGILLLSITLMLVAIAQSISEPLPTRRWLYLACLAQIGGCVAAYLLARMKISNVGPRPLLLKLGMGALIGCVCTASFAFCYNFLIQGACPWTAETVCNKVFKQESTIDDPQVKGNYFETMSRIDDTGVASLADRADNWGWLANQHSTALYNSMLNGDLHRWFKRLYDISGFAVAPSYYRGFDDRYFLEIAWGVKYKTGMHRRAASEEGYDLVPYGRYELHKGHDGNTYYENALEVGIDMWYPSAITQKEFDSMDYAERDAALLQTVVVPDEVAKRYPTTTLDDVTDTVFLDWKSASLENCTLNSGVLLANEGAKIVFPLTARGSSREGEWLFTCDVEPIDDERYTLTVNGKSQLKMPSTYPWAYPLTEYSFSIPGDKTSLVIQLTPGSYELNNLRIAYNSYEKVDGWVAARNETNLENLTVDGDRIQGGIECGEAGILVLSVPYSKGWSCMVDGAPVQLFVANGAFIGMELPQGSHDIVLSYSPPYLLVGMIISSCTGCILALYVAIGHLTLRLKRGEYLLVKDKLRRGRMPRKILSSTRSLNFREAFWYAFAGVSAALLEIGLLSLFYYGLGFSVGASNVAAVILATAYNFLFNRKVSFRNSGSLARSIVLYALLFAANTAISTLVVVLAESHHFSILLAKAFTMVCIACWNYILYKKVVFS